MTLKSNNTKPNIEGISGHLWSEVVRTDEQMEYMIYPRLFALAERAWYQSKWEPEFKPITEYSATTNFIDKVQVEEDYTGFINAIGYKELGKLDRLGIQYRLPMVGSRVENGMVLLRSEIPGVLIQYSSDQKQWKHYDGTGIPLTSGNALYVRTISSDYKRTGRISSVVG
ncbi:immunoglobulin E-set [Globomyces pollinis-pini]|nr:immunoglobulin E-set [Globomyces pollinis-pini]